MEIKENSQGFSSGAVTDTSEGPKELLIKDAIFVRDKGCYIKIRFTDILYLKGDGNYTILMTAEKPYSLRNILKEFEEILPPHLFMRIHKSYIINLNKVNTISSKEITVATDKIPVGRTYYQSLIGGVHKLGANGFSE